jgi:hypothetical protein
MHACRAYTVDRPSFGSHLDWAVLENELKWYYTQAIQGA